MTRYGIFFSLWVGLLSLLTAQSELAMKLEKAKVKPYVMLQFWGTYTHGENLINSENGEKEPVENRINLLLRRGRVGLKAQPYARLKLNLVSSFDLIGRDLLAGTNGGSNPATPAVSVWDAFMQYQILKDKESLHLTAGFFRPQLGRENITSGWSVNSLEKAMSQTYLRRHLVGTGPGRATGINLGGLLLRNQFVSLNYNLGFFNPLFTDPDRKGTSAGTRFAPLWVGRLVLNLGDPEQQQYRIGYDINYFGKRKGLSLGLGGSRQGPTDCFAQSTTLSTDLLFNYGPLNVDGEVAYLLREGERALADGKQRSFGYGAYTGHIRLGANVLNQSWGVVEPVFMYMFFEGKTDAESQADAVAVGASSGREQTFDVGVNWYLDGKRLKLALHYTWRQGDAGALGPTALPNDFFRQGGLGAIQRGNWLGLGLGMIF